MAISDSKNSTEFATGGDFDFAVKIMQVGLNEVKCVQKFTHVGGVTCIQFDVDKVVASTGGIIKASFCLGG